MADNNSWRCSVCGYIHTASNPPNICPVCGAMKPEFKIYSDGKPVASSPKTLRWKCINCSYVHEGEHPPATCPVCGAEKEKFMPAEEQVQPTGAQAVKVLILGAGIAGITAAETIRTVSPQSQLTLISMENELPYYRLNLTRYIGNEISRDDLFIHDKKWYADNNIELIQGQWFHEIDKASKTILSLDGSSAAYEKLIVAAGAHAFYPPIPGSDLEGVFTLRTLEDADGIINCSRKGGRCVCIGGGILGIEAAGAVARRGVDVMLIEKYDYLMPRQLNSKAAAILEKHLLSSGVKIIRNSTTKEIAGKGRVSEVRLNDGSSLTADFVIIATGVRPNTVLARKAGLEVNDGIIVDNHLRTSCQDIYAAGDVAEHDKTLYGTWAPAQFQGKIAALNALGISASFGGIPRSNTIKLLGLDLTSIGKINPEDGSYVIIEKEEPKSYLGFIFHDGRIVGSILLGYSELAACVKKAIDQKTDCTEAIRAMSAEAIIEKLKKEMS